MDEDYEKLLDDYIAELAPARDEAQRWWDGLLRAERDAKEAYANVRRRWPAGPASFPRILAIYRKYFLACEALNEQRENITTGTTTWGETDEEGTIILKPQTLLLENLETRDRDLAVFMQALVFSPIGADDQGKAT